MNLEMYWGAKVVGKKNDGGREGEHSVENMTKEGCRSDEGVMEE